MYLYNVEFAGDHFWVGTTVEAETAPPTQNNLYEGLVKMLERW